VTHGHEFRHGADWTPAAVGHRNWNWNHRALNGGYAGNYDNPGYYPAPAYAAPVYAAPVYAAPAYAAPAYSAYGGGNGCNGAQRVMRTYARDRATGHPAAAYDLLRQNQWAMRSGCAGGAPMGGGLLGGLGGLGGYGGAQQYSNYGRGGLVGLGGYRGAPAYGNTGYGQGYGNGSMISPLLQYIR
jgi:hypothetical protein